MLVNLIAKSFNVIRVKKIIDLVGSDRFGQTFITDTSERRIKEAVTSFSDETQIFNLSEMVYG